MDISILNPEDTDFIQNPHPIYQKLIEKSPIHWHPKYEAWFVFGYHAAKKFLKEGSSELKELEGQPVADWIILGDSEKHQAVRTLLRSYFNKPNIDHLREDIAQRMANQILAIEEKGECNLVTEFSQNIPAATIAQIFGLHEFEFLQNHLGKMTPLLDSFAYFSLEEEMEDITSSFQIVADYFIQNLDTCSDSSILAVAKNLPKDIPFEFFLHNLVFLFLAGYETTSAYLANMLHLFLRQPEIGYNLIRNGFSSKANHELLRYLSPVQATQRKVVTKEIFENAVMYPGQDIFIFIGAANRDPKVFEEPQQLNWQRSNNPHLGFSFGNHACLGSHLGMLHGEVFMRYLEKILSWKVEKVTWSPLITSRRPQKILIRQPI